MDLKSWVAGVGGGYGAVLTCITIGTSGGVMNMRVASNAENFLSSCTSKGKGKAVPLQAWSGPEGSRKMGSQIS